MSMQTEQDCLLVSSTWSVTTLVDLSVRIARYSQKGCCLEQMAAKQVIELSLRCEVSFMRSCLSRIGVSSWLQSVSELRHIRDTQASRTSLKAGRDAILRSEHIQRIFAETHRTYKRSLCSSRTAHALHQTPSRTRAVITQYAHLPPLSPLIKALMKPMPHLRESNRRMKMPICRDSAARTLANCASARTSVKVSPICSEYTTCKPCCMNQGQQSSPTPANWLRCRCDATMSCTPAFF